MSTWAWLVQAGSLLYPGRGPGGGAGAAPIHRGQGRVVLVNRPGWPWSPDYPDRRVDHGTSSMVNGAARCRGHGVASRGRCCGARRASARRSPGCAERPSSGARCRCGPSGRPPGTSHRAIRAPFSRSTSGASRATPVQQRWPDACSGRPSDGSPAWGRRTGTSPPRAHATPGGTSRTTESRPDRGCQVPRIRGLFKSGCDPFSLEGADSPAGAAEDAFADPAAEFGA